MKKYFIYTIFAIGGMLAAKNCLAEDTGIWDNTKEIASDTWDGTKKVTGDVWDGTKKVAGDVKDGITGDENPPASSNNPKMQSGTENCTNKAKE